MKKIIASLLVAATTLGLSSVNVMATSNTQESDKLKVMTSFNPVYQLVKTIGGDKVDVEMIIEPGLEPHDFEPTPQDLVKVQESKILFINGLEMEPWAENLKDVEVVDLSLNVETFKLNHEDEDKDHEKVSSNTSNASKKDNHHEQTSSNTSNSSKMDQHEKEDEHGHGHEHGEFDPHIWLGSNQLKVMAKNTYDGLVKADAKNEKIYKENYDKFISELDALDKEFKPQFEGLKNKSFVTGHEAFAYLCKNLGLEQKAVVGVFGEGEPTPKDLEELVKFVKDNKITTIFTEGGQSPEISQTLAAETDAKTVEIETLETEGEIIPTLRSIYTKIIEANK